MATQTMTQPVGTTPGSQEVHAGRVLRSGYRNLHARAIRDGEDLVSLEKSRLAEMLAEANTLQEQVQRPREQAVDSEVFAHLTDRGVELAKKLAHGGKGHTAKDFLRRLKAQYVNSSQAQDDGADDPSAFNWAQMGFDVGHMFRPVPGIFCMVGPLDAKAKPRRVVVRREKQQLGELTRPDEVQDLDETEKQETDKNLEEMFEVLKREGSVPLLELVLNHASFAQTVENLFSSSFLVKEGHVSLTRDEEKGVTVNRVAKSLDETEVAPEAERMQLVINLTMAIWQQWKAVCPPEACRMRHRAPRDHGAAEAADSQPMQETDEEEGADEAGPSGSSPAADPPATAPAAGRGRGPGSTGGRSQQKGKGRARAAAVSEDEESDEEEEAAPKSRSKRRK